MLLKHLKKNSFRIMKGNKATKTQRVAESERI